MDLLSAVMGAALSVVICVSWSQQRLIRKSHEIQRLAAFVRSEDDPMEPAIAWQFGHPWDDPSQVYAVCIDAPDALGSRVLGLYPTAHDARVGAQAAAMAIRAVASDLR